MIKKYHLVIFGCQMNISDAERLATILEKIGYQQTNSSKEADLIAIIACSVRQMAINRVYGIINQVSKFKNQNVKSKCKIILTGCLPEKDKKQLSNQVDLIFDIKDLNRLPRLISKLKAQNSKSQLKIKNYLEIEPNRSTFPIAYIPIMTGCNNFCSYCVVPYTRGKEISRPVQEIIKEVKIAIKNKYKMIVLLGQNVNSYNSNLNFPKLLEKVANLHGDFWLTFISSHPKDLFDELINIMAKNKKIMPYLHLPVQSGDNDVLKKMNRHYTIAHYKNLIRKVHHKIPLINISTDIIVGFCGETKKQFENTVKLMRLVKYDMAYLAKYSPRPGTSAMKLKDNVSQKEKIRRWNVLAKILKQTATNKNKKYLGKVIDVLIENKKNSQLFGKSRSFKNIKINTQIALTCTSHLRNTNAPTLKLKKNGLIGKFIKVKIIKTSPWGLEGKIL